MWWLPLLALNVQPCCSSSLTSALLFMVVIVPTTYFFGIHDRASTAVVCSHCEFKQAMVKMAYIQQGDQAKSYLMQLHKMPQGLFLRSRSQTVLRSFCATLSCKNCKVASELGRLGLTFSACSK